MNDVCIVSAIRTAVGSLGKSFKNIKAEELGSAVITSSMKKLSLVDVQIEHLMLLLNG